MRDSQSYFAKNAPLTHPASRKVREVPLAALGVYRTPWTTPDAWVDYRLHKHLEVFAFDLIAYAVVEGLCHLVLKPTVQQNPEALTAREVAERWILLFYPPPLIRRYLRGEHLTSLELQTVGWVTSSWRRKLADKGCLVRSLNKDFPVRLVARLN